MSWTPLPHEADLFYNVYIDESSQTKHRYLVLGGLVVPLECASAFETDILAARDSIIAPIGGDGTPRTIKWQKANNYNLLAYKKVIDAYFSFPQRHKLKLHKFVEVHCIAVDTSKRDLRESGGGDIEIGFNKEIYFLCAAMIGKRLKNELFHVYPDRRTTNHSLDEARQIMNFGTRKYGDKREWPFRRLRFEDPENCQALQVVDILIGAVAYRLNGHYEKSGANAAKKELSDYILRRAKISNPFVKTPYHLRRLAIMHRNKITYMKRG